MTDSITFTVPSPPSFNSLYRNTSQDERDRAKVVGKTLKGRRRTHAYNTWANAAGWCLKVENGKARTWQPIEGPVRVEIVTGNARQDNDAGVKAIFDLLTEHRVWLDDRQVRRHEVVYGGPSRETIVTVTPL